MNKLVALMLAVALPALAQQQTTLVPSFEQADEPQPAVVAAQQPLHAQAKTWIIAGAATVMLVAIITVAVTVVKASESKPLKQSDFPCSRMGGCDGWVNQPPQ